MNSITWQQFRLSDSKKKNNEVLKLLAMIFMVIDHVGAIFFPENILFRILGRLALPIFAYQLAQGYMHTSNLSKYLFRLWIFALISQIPYTIVFDTFTLNILFTFVISLFLMDKIHKKEYYWIPIILFLAYFIKVDYGYYGILLPIVFYWERKSKILSLILSSMMTILRAWYLKNGIILFTLLGIVLALYFPKNGMTIKINKYFFYWFYPLHLAVLLGIKILINT